jgi:[pyruvate, water dikinase]-phosphate phosphotransferase / [pyruvate, water dikinase] kinase
MLPLVDFRGGREQYSAMAQRTVFVISDRTAVTAETLGHSLLTQFDGVVFKSITVPFVDTVDKAKEVAAKIDYIAAKEGERPIIITSLVQDDVRRPLLDCNALVLDVFETFLGPLEVELGRKCSHTLGRAHGMTDAKRYNLRIEATNFALACDDGHGLQHYSDADLILMGVSRSGKTPTCLYLALQYGIFAANYPLAEDDFEETKLPQGLEHFRSKLYGLTISPERLRHIRMERRSAGRYATAQQVNFELRAAEAMFRRFSIPFMDTTSSSIEEIASTILSVTGLERRVHS